MHAKAPFLYERRLIVNVRQKDRNEKACYICNITVFDVFNF